MSNIVRKRSQTSTQCTPPVSFWCSLTSGMKMRLLLHKQRRHFLLLLPSPTVKFSELTLFSVSSDLRCCERADAGEPLVRRADPGRGDVASLASSSNGVNVT
eukprot:CAMPEP_0180565240 /NCGR_PEP_ID=MMETSP1037_2-20121125/5440_1 /TAXON_ID=632150 /ORGANISM="Azadinium spinosum, Strain 3D9" /LENGTH=101 /DNA_ID=CAMNT_0022582197 /DNA_START=569 /DNA_END=874 /DNA_ORIENTATION=+